MLDIAQIQRARNPGTYFVESFEVEGLWGNKARLVVPLGKPVNILIGPNASGKTTVLNLLRCVLQVDVLGLLDVIFRSVKVVLRDSRSTSKRTVTVSITESELVYRVSRKVLRIPVEPYAFEKNVPRLIRQRVQHARQLVANELQYVAGIVWLPVSRRLPISDDDPEDRFSSNRGRMVESVDHRLSDLLRQLSQYRFQLDSQMAAEYKAFEKSALGVFLYDKNHDAFDLGRVKGSLPSASEKDHLLRAFEVADLLTPQMRKKIDEHFRESEVAIQRISAIGPGGAIKANDAFFIPLVSRTKAMIDLARSLEERRKEIFAPLVRLMEEINRFFSGKSVALGQNGELTVNIKSGESIRAEQLSSGEKQLLILLVQALLRIDEPVMYIADEPELSLHVTWQERLISSLLAIGGKLQIVFATHSPDIVADYSDSVIDFSRI